jgi:hypothetical protein
MKKSGLILTILMFIGLGQMNGQAFDKGTKVVAFGIGIGSSLGSFSHTSQIPALSLQYEQGIWEAGSDGVISLGGYVGYKSFNQKSSAGNFDFTSKWNYTIIGIRSAYHYQGLENERIDLYGGLMLGYYILKYTYEDNTGSSSPIGSGNYGSSAGLTIYLGGRYYLTDNIAAFVELGYGVSYLNLGINLRF